jgi:tetratricopeptide (TPR) repeat protein
MIQPAENHQASMTKVVAILPFDGNSGAEFAAELEGVLGSVNIDEKQYFTLVERTAIDKVMSELKLSHSGMVDENTAAKIGKMLGAKGIYTGRVTLFRATDSRYTESRQECARHQIVYDDKGNAHEGNCIHWRNYNVDCTKRVANFACSPKLIEVDTGKIIYSRNLSGSADSSGCEDKKPPQTEDELLAAAKKIVLNQFRKDVAPYYVTQQVTLMDSTDGISSSEAKDKLKKGIDFAKNNRLDRSCELWGEARIISPNSPSILFDLGVCAESRGDLDAALSLYKEADKLIGKPDDNISLALSRVSEQIKSREKLKEQLK